MLFLLRNLRKKLITSGKFTTYLFYAVGEIILVVTGILIAVSIDNLNEQNKTLAKEQETIQSLNQEFQENLIALQSNMGRLEAVINACETLSIQISPHYKNGSINNMDSILAQTVSFPTWSPSTYILNDIKSSGKLTAMSNPELKKLLLEWDRIFSDLEEWHRFYEDGSNKYFDYLLKNTVAKNMNIYSGLVGTDKSEFL